jgi:hypothetical protein
VKENWAEFRRINDGLIAEEIAELRREAQRLSTLGLARRFCQLAFPRTFGQVWRDETIRPEQAASSSKIIDLETTRKERYAVGRYDCGEV